MKFQEIKTEEDLKLCGEVCHLCGSKLTFERRKSVYSDDRFVFICKNNILDWKAQEFIKGGNKVSHFLAVYYVCGGSNRISFSHFNYRFVREEASYWICNNLLNNTCEMTSYIDNTTTKIVIKNFIESDTQILETIMNYSIME